jgi:hypothetical protein
VPDEALTPEADAAPDVAVSPHGPTAITGLTSGAALLLMLADRPGAHRLILTRELSATSGEPYVIRVRDGRVVGAEGPIDADALERLRAEGRIQAPLRGEESDALSDALRSGRLRPIDVARARREALEARLSALARARAASAELMADDQDADGAVPPHPLTRRLETIALEALRADDARASSATCARGPAAFALTDDAAAALARWGVLPEEIAALEELAGRDLASLTFGSHGVRGLEPLIALLLELGLARPQLPDEAPPASAESLAAYLGTLSARAVDGDYFAILGLAPGADQAELERAHARLTFELEAIDPGGLSRPDLCDALDEAREAVEEAYAALGDERHRRAYVHALAAPQVGR